MTSRVPALKLSGLYKAFGEKIAVDHVDLEVPEGSFFGLVGPNGAGKTTSLSMAVGLLKPDDGKSVIFGADVWADPSAAKKIIGVLPDGLSMPGPVAGVATGVPLAWLLGRIAADRLTAGGAELLHRMRSGPAHKPGGGSSFDWDSLNVQLGDLDFGGQRLGLDQAPPARRIAVWTLLTLCWVPLIAQGMVPALMILTDSVNPSWFLAFHVPGSLRWAAVFTMMGIGLLALCAGLYLLLKTWRESRRPAPAG